MGHEKTVGFWWSRYVRVRVRWMYHHTPRGRIRVIRHLFNSNNFATSAALAEVCALLSAILVVIITQITISQPAESRRIAGAK